MKVVFVSLGSQTPKNIHITSCRNFNSLENACVCLDTHFCILISQHFFVSLWNFFCFPRYPWVFIPGLILRGTVGRQGRDLSQESLLHSQGLETKNTCLSEQSPFHSGQPSFVSLWIYDSNQHVSCPILKLWYFNVHNCLPNHLSFNSFFFLKYP